MSNRGGTYTDASGNVLHGDGRPALPPVRVEAVVGRQTEHFVCPDCGHHVEADEDGCCTMCGADCTVTPCNCQPPNPTDQRPETGETES
jgi:predicted amidophosphoribosyltransferase